MAIKQYTKHQTDAMKDKTDYQRLKNMTEEEIEKNADSDLDSNTPTKEQLKKFKKALNRKLERVENEN